MLVDGNGLLAWFKNLFKAPDQQGELDRALNLLYTVDPECKRVVDAVREMGLKVTFTAASLGGVSLATTSVDRTGAEVIVDVFKVGRCHDHLVPVLAHEIFHIKQAFLIFGLEDFCAKVARDADRRWDLREVEIGAVEYENQLRGRLIEAPYWRSRIHRTRQDAQKFAALSGVRH